jgi:hypothetical protein
MPAKPIPARPGAIRGQVLDIAPVRSGIVRSGREYTRETRIVPVKDRRALLIGEKPVERPPEWFEPDVRECTRNAIWLELGPVERNRLLAQRSALSFSVRAPVDVILWSQYHALKALAIRLDAGIGTERDRAMFEAGLREYDANYDRIRAECFGL